MERPLAILLKDVAVAYARDDEVRLVLEHINIHIAPQEMVAILGGNGSGKSTLLKVMAGLLPVSTGQADHSAASPVPIVFQNPDAQIVGLTVREDICFGMENLAVPPEQMEERASRALAAVGLEGYEERLVAHLSGGQKQRLCIASAIAMNPDIYILDEPTAMLDPDARLQVIDILRQLNTAGKTVVWATQSMEEAACAHRIIALKSGRIEYDGSPEEFFYGKPDGFRGDLASDTSHDGAIPCRMLGYHLPYGIEVVQALQRSGLLANMRPVQADECMEAVIRLCR